MLFKLDIPSTVGGYPDAPVQEMVRFVPGESSGDRRLAVTGVSGKVAHPVASMARNIHRTCDGRRNLFRVVDEHIHL